MNRFAVVSGLNFLLLSAVLVAQVSVSGSVTDLETGDPLVGANVVVEGSELGTSTGRDGSFKIDKVPNGSMITVSMIGYTRSSMTASRNMNFKLSSTLVELSPLEVLANRAGSNTPVRAENVDKQAMELRLGSQDIPLVLNTIPGVFASEQGGGAGDATVHVRGFNQRNVAIMINGVPVNDLENGWVYWSNWDGVGDATKSIQLQKGMGNVNLATPAIGGTMNIVTDPASKERGGFFKQELGEWNFLKTTVGYNSGLINDRFALSGLVVRKVGDGYRGGTWTDAWAYSFGATYRVSDKDQLEFYAIGAPQRHGQALYAQNIGAIDEAYAKSLSDYDQNALVSVDPEDGEYIGSGHDFNQNWAPVASDYSDQQYFRMWGHNTESRMKSNLLNERENFFHKPIVGLNYYRKLNEAMRLSTVLYHSPGEGGGTGTYGDVARIDANGESDLSVDGHKFYYGPSPWTWDWNGMVAANSGSASDVVVFQRDTVSRGDGESIGVLRNSTNIQKVSGLVTKFDYDFSSELSFGAGLDYRWADIYHVKYIRDLLGGSYFVNTDSDFDAPGTQKGLGDPVDYDFINYINWLGGYGQVAYNSGPLTAFAMLGFSTTTFRHTNNFKKAADGVSRLKLEQSGLSGHQIKLGGRYALSSDLSVFGNFGLVSKLPNFDQVIDDYTAIVNPDQKNEEFNSVEVGVDYRLNDLTVTGTYYNTSWKERVYKYEEYELESGDEITAWLHGVDAVHSGLEFTLAYQPIDLLRVDIAGSMGDWKHSDDASGEIRFRSVNPLYGDAADTSYTVNYYIKDLPTGGAPQNQFVLGLSTFPIDGLKVQLLVRMNSNYYSTYNPFTRTDQSDTATSWKIPDYTVMDLHGAYDLPFGIGGLKPSLFFHMFNITDEKYILQAVDNSKYNAWDGDHDADDAEVFFGLPLRWNAGVSINF